MTERTRKIHVINGPNLNMLGKREVGIYGLLTLDQINKGLEKKASALGIELDFFQSNHEGDILDRIHRLHDERAEGLIINPGGLTHTSVVLRDALLILNCPVIEIHLSNIYRREKFRRKSVLADIATGQITGFGDYGYHMALNAIDKMTNES